MKVTSLHHEAYGQWAGNERGYPPDPKRCCETVSDGWKTKQCSRPRGHGPEEAYCHQHSPAEVERRDKIAKIRYEKNLRRWRVEHNAHKLLEVVTRIAEGHNDAMGLAQETLTELKLW